MLLASHHGLNRRARILIAALALWLVPMSLAAQTLVDQVELIPDDVTFDAIPSAPPALDERCVVTILNRTAQVLPDGMVLVQNVPANFGPVRARATCVVDGVTITGQSQLFNLVSGGTANIGEVTFDSPVPIPESLALTAAPSSLTSSGSTSQISAFAVFGDGGNVDVTTDPATSYISSNRAIATVSEAGVVRAVSGGPVVITVLHEGVSAFVRVVVDLGTTDRDGDGIPDDVELAHGLDPDDPLDGFADADGDGLTNKEELVDFGTDLRVADSDGDGLTDVTEVRSLGTNPLAADTDGDGVRDGLEVQTGSDPLNAQSLNLAAALSSIAVSPAQFVLTVDTIVGEDALQLGVTGSLIDGTTLDLTPTSRGTAYQSSDLAVCGFDATAGRVRSGGSGVCSITVSNGLFTAIASGLVQSFAPTALSFVAIPGSANNVDVQGGFAYVASGGTGLRVVNVSNPLVPQIVGLLDTPGNGNDVKVVGITAYLADGATGLSVIDVSNPSVPVLLGTADTPGIAQDVAIKGSLVYVADGATGLQIVDVADPTAPIVVGAVDTAGTAKGVAVMADRDIAVVADGTGGLRVVDVANPAAPTIIASLSLGPSGDARDVAVQGNFAFVADYVRSFTSVDLTNPALPVLRTQLPSATAGRLTDVVLAGRFALGSDIVFLNHVPIVDVATPAAPLSRGSVNFSAYRNDEGMGLAADAAYVYLVTSQSVSENQATGNSRLYIGQYLSRDDGFGIAPTVQITAPAPGATVIEDDLLSITLVATDDVAVANADFVVDGVRVQSDGAPPYQHTVTVPTGVATVTLDATAIDFGNNVGVAPSVTLNVIPDPATTAVGRVVDQANVGVAGATVSCLGVSGTSGAGGNYSIPGVPTIRGNVVCNATLLDAFGRTLTGSVTGGAPVRGGSTAIANLVIALRVSFAAELSFPTGFWPTNMQVADFDGDGHLDVVNNNSETNAHSVGVLRGNGNGTLQTRQLVPVGLIPADVAVGDLNGDGHPDIVSANVSSDDVSVLLGVGNGSFLTQQRYLVGVAAGAVEIGDVDADGALDVVTTGSGSVSVLFGQGDGTLAAALPVATSNGPSNLTLADLDGDGDADIAVTGSNNVSILISHGDGTFATPQLFAVGNGPNDLASGDFNGDGFLDLVVTNLSGSDFSVLNGRGDGTFLPERRYASAGNGPSDVAVVDVDRDGFPDVVYTNFSSSGFSVHLNDGLGTLLPRQGVVIPGGNIRGLAVGDMNGDGRPDVMVVGYGSSRVYVSLQQ